MRKFELNRERDARKRRELEARGWIVHEVWECDIRERLPETIADHRPRPVAAPCRRGPSAHLEERAHEGAAAAPAASQAIASVARPARSAPSTEARPTSTPARARTDSPATAAELSALACRDGHVDEPVLLARPRVEGVHVRGHEPQLVGAAGRSTHRGSRPCGPRCPGAASPAASSAAPSATAAWSPLLERQELAGRPFHLTRSTACLHREQDIDCVMPWTGMPAARSPGQSRRLDRGPRLRLGAVQLHGPQAAARTAMMPSRMAMARWNRVPASVVWTVSRSITAAVL